MARDIRRLIRRGIRRTIRRYDNGYYLELIKQRTGDFLAIGTADTIFYSNGNITRWDNNPSLSNGGIDYDLINSLIQQRTFLDFNGTSSYCELSSIITYTGDFRVYFKIATSATLTGTTPIVGGDGGATEHVLVYLNASGVPVVGIYNGTNQTYLNTAVAVNDGDLYEGYVDRTGTTLTLSVGATTVTKTIVVATVKFQYVGKLTSVYWIDFVSDIIFENTASGTQTFPLNEATANTESNLEGTNTLTYNNITSRYLNMILATDGTEWANGTNTLTNAVVQPCISNSTLNGKTVLSSTGADNAVLRPNVKTYVDNGQRSDENPLSNNGQWVSGAGFNDFKLVSNQFLATSTNSVAFLGNMPTNTVNQSCTLTVDTLSNFSGGMLRYDDATGDCYRLYMQSGGNLIILVTVGGGTTTLSTAVSVVSNGDEVTFEATGTGNDIILKTYVNGSLEDTYAVGATVADQIDSGVAGMRCGSTTTFAFSNFSTAILDDSASLPIVVTNPNTIYLTLKADNTADLRTFFDEFDSAGFSAYQDTSQYEWTDGTTIVDDGTLTTNLTTLVFVSNGASSFMGVTSGGTYTEYAVSLLTNPLDFITLLGKFDGTEAYKGVMCTWAIADSAHSSADAEANSADFQLSAGDVALAAWTFSDNFNRANENLSASVNWTLVVGSASWAQVVSNQLQSSGASRTLNVVAGSQSIDPEHWCEIVSTVSVGHQQLRVRQNDTDELGYYCQLNAPTGKLDLGHYTAGGSFTAFASSAGSFVATDLIGFHVKTVAGDVVLTAYINNVSAVTYTVTTAGLKITSGGVGIRTFASSGTSISDDFDASEGVYPATFITGLAGEMLTGVGGELLTLI